MRIVIKLGSSTVTREGVLNAPLLLGYVREITALREQGHQIVLVSSGAVAAGRAAMRSLRAGERAVSAKQMLAAIGQPRLMALYAQLFGHFDATVAQVLLTRGDLEHRRRYLNARHTLESLMAAGVIPIVNENDTVATEEIRVGDNDQLSALVAALIDARLLLLMTDQNGLYSANPRTDPQAHLIERVTDAEIPESLWQAARGGAGALGSGGMFTKLKAAEIARRHGAEVVIAHGGLPQHLPDLVAGGGSGTRFTASSAPIDARSRYILAGLRDGVGAFVDAGAVQALHEGRSLLCVGVQRVEGEFDRGDSVAIHALDGKLIARGIANYSAFEMLRVAGRRSGERATILGYDHGPEFIHRNDLVMW